MIVDPVPYAAAAALFDITVNGINRSANTGCASMIKTMCVNDIKHTGRNRLELFAAGYDLGAAGLDCHFATSQFGDQLVISISHVRCT